MSVRAGASWTNVGDAFEAGREATNLALHQIGEDSADLALVFSSPSYSSADLLEGVRAVVGGVPILGCTDAGNLTREGPIHNSVAVMLIRAPLLEIRPGAGDKLSQDPEEAGRAMAQQALDGRLGHGSGPGTLLMTFCEGIHGNLSSVIRGAQKVVGATFPIIGAAAGDDLAFQQSSQYCLSYLLKDSAVGFLLGGPVRFGLGTRHGWQPISRARTVTRAEGSMLIEIDEAPAVNLYREYLGPFVADLTDETIARMACIYPLGFAVEEEFEPLVRYPLRVTEDGALELSGDVAEGAQARLMLGSREGIVSSARQAAQDARAQVGTVRAGVVFSNYARERVMGRDAAREMFAIREVLGENVPLVGFYGYGEFSPSGMNGANRMEGSTQVRNDSVVVFTVGED